MALISKKEKNEIIKKHHLNPDIQVKTIAVLNIPVSFLGFTKDHREMWKSHDGKTLYIMN